jgi:hypothetical protein
MRKVLVLLIFSSCTRPPCYQTNKENIELRREIVSLSRNFDYMNRKYQELVKHLKLRLDFYEK